MIGYRDFTDGGGDPLPAGSRQEHFGSGMGCAVTKDNVAELTHAAGVEESLRGPQKEARDDPGNAGFGHHVPLLLRRRLHSRICNWLLSIASWRSMSLISGC